MLEASTVRREGLEKALRVKLEREIRRLKEENISLRCTYIAWWAKVLFIYVHGTSILTYNFSVLSTHDIMNFPMLCLQRS